MVANNKVSTDIEISKIELEATMNMRLNELKSETVSSIHIKLSTLKSNKPSSSYYQPSAGLIKLVSLNGHFSSCLENMPMHHNSPKHISSMTLKGDTLLQIKKLWYYIPSTFYQYLSTNKYCP